MGGLKLDFYEKKSELEKDTMVLTVPAPVPNAWKMFKVSDTNHTKNRIQYGTEN